MSIPEASLTSPTSPNAGVPAATPEGIPPAWPDSKWPAFPIVGIGASAGGLESLERLFSHMPRHTGMAFIVIQHLSPDFKSVIDELLARRTRIPILQAAEGAAVERDTVYLLPPRKEMIIKGGRLHLTDKHPKQGFTLPIDHFFRALALDAGPMARAIVLSGTGTDGSRGIVEVERMGGVVIAESEHSAKFDGMPIAAQNTGVVAHVLRPEEMPAALLGSLDVLHGGRRDGEGDTDTSEYQKKIFELVELNTDFKHLLDATDVGILFLDANLRIRKYTSRISGIFHFLPNDVGRKLTDFSHDLDRPELVSEVKQALETGAVIESEVRDGAGNCFFLRVLPYRLGATTEGGDRPEGKAASSASGVQGVVLTFTDISTLAEARSRLDKLSAIVESSDDAIVGKDLDGTITTWNGGAERLYGYRAAEAIGMNAVEYVPRSRRDEEEHFLQKLARGERIDHVETLRKHKNGREIAVSVTMSPICDSKGAVIGISSIGRDVTQLAEARRVVKEREEHIRLLLESMAEGVYGVDLNGVCTFANPSCARMLGCAEPKELAGKSMHAHHSVASGEHGAIATMELCPLEVGSREGQNVHADDHAFVRADGATFPVEFWSHPVSAGGKLVGAVVTFIDIAERKKAEEEIRVAARRREEFLAMLSHELRNPLAAVLNATTLMSAASAEPTMIESARMVVQRQAAHMARLLDDLLDVARITRGAVGLQKRFADLRDSAEAAAEALRPLFQVHKTELVLDMPDEPLPIHGDPDRLQQIHANLIGNAASYSNDGSRVIVSLKRDGQHAVLKVKDHGIGIAPDLLPHIFELFVQGEQNLDRSKGGLGIGLTLVKMLVELHGGTVHAASAGAGCGSEFTVRLPLCMDAPAEEPERRVDNTVSRKIVLVEDHEDSRQLLKMLLETKGFSVVEASDGLSAITAIQATQPDVALVDIGLPGMDGYEVARTIRTDSSLDRLVLVALTGYGRDSDIQRAKAAGFNHHLTKPVRPEVLEALLVDL